MKGLLCGCIFALVAFTSCSRDNQYALRYHDSGRAKPIVAVIPLVNHTNVNLDWDISEEITAGISKKLLEKGRLYLIETDALNPIAKKIQNHDIFSIDQKDLMQFNSSNEFVVLMELIEHKNIPYHRQHIKPIYPTDGKATSVLMMKVRVKVLDFRSGEPQVVLQEIVHSNHMIPEKTSYYNADSLDWGEEMYDSTPLGRAHARLERDLASQLEKYITIAKR